VVELMHKDSLDLTAADRARIVEASRTALSRIEASDGEGGVVILHGTDTLADTGDLLARDLGEATRPIVLTGAIRPFEMKRSDALQNLTEAIFATGALQPGVWVVAHGRALRFPGVRKDRATQSFVRA
jgi:L-asparaginase